ncbi:MAG TPA: hypothetical protein VK680_07010, partial [Solirubrobacteraceae bacterium]|nr:hypothetical protein [Solirubrobacteraceae bacterium]
MSVLSRGRGGASRQVVAPIAALALFAVLPCAPANADAVVPDVAWTAQTVAQPTSFSTHQSLPCEEHGNCDRYLVVLTNVGTRASMGKITVVDALPAGITTDGPPSGENEWMRWECKAEEGTGHEVLTCTTESTIPALTPAASIDVPITVIPSAFGILVNHVEISGGGAVSVTAQASTPIGALPQFFGVLEESLDASVLNAAGAPDAIAGDHPGAQFTSFTFPSAYSLDGETSLRPVEEVKQIVIDLPAGLIGDTLASPTCSLSDITDLTGALTQCPAASKIGKAVVLEPGRAETEATIFNATPERGHLAEFAVFIPTVQRAEFLYATIVGSGASTHLRIVSAPLSGAISLVGASFTFFGEPAVVDGSSSSPIALFTNPSDCDASGFVSVIHVDSWQHPGRVQPDGQPDFSDPNWKSVSAQSPPVTGCEALQFHPTFSFAPEEGHRQVDEPAGYEATLQVPQNEDPNGLATPPLKTAVVTLPPGVAISPAAANGLRGCQQTGSEGIELQSPDLGHCPLASTVGGAELEMPMLGEALKGSVYLAQPLCGGPGQPGCTEEAAETGGLFGLYVEMGSEDAGVHLKLTGKVEVGGDGLHSRLVGLEPGQLRLTLAEVPQEPLSELHLRFTGGPGAFLANPQTCGSFTTVSELEPWSHQPAPGEAEGTPSVTLRPTFTIAGCESKFAPGFVAGTVNSQAGAYSPFTLTFSRQDREQDLSTITASMPPGLLGKIPGIPQCGEREANTGTCPAASRIGSDAVAVGAGERPFWLSGSAYLTGPYAGAPLGLSVVVPAQVGPFNLGNIVVRASISIDPHTAALTVAINPLPSSLDGVPLRIRTVNLTIENFTSNPTNCDPFAIDATISSIQGASAEVSSPFQATTCRTLPFEPKLTALTSGNGQFTGHGASLHVEVTTAQGQADMRSLKLDLPQRLPARLETIQHACREAVFAANPSACPNASVIGLATVATPVLGVPLRGPAYLVAKSAKVTASGAPGFPDLVLILQGDGVTIDLTGQLYVDAHNFTSVAFKV